MGLLFIATQLLALILALPFKSTGAQAFEDPDNPTNPLIYIALLLLFTGIILLIIKFRGDRPIRVIFLGAMGFIIFYILYLLIYVLCPYAVVLGYFYYDVPLFTSIILACAITYAMIKYPEWYVIDTVGMLVGGGAAALLGISFGILPAFILLAALAVYDAISVYKTKHMLSLADSAIGLKLPILLVVPKVRGYSFRKQEKLGLREDERRERDALFMGLGDVIIPGILVVSSYIYLPSAGLWNVPASVLVSLCTLLGAFLGYMAVINIALKGRPQPGLPLLNSGAILGYLIAYLLFYGNISFGIV